MHATRKSRRDSASSFRGTRGYLSTPFRHRAGGDTAAPSDIAPARPGGGGSAARGTGRFWGVVHALARKWRGGMKRGQPSGGRRAALGRGAVRQVAHGGTRGRGTGPLWGIPAQGGEGRGQ